MDPYPDTFSVVELEPNYKAVSLGRQFVTTDAADELARHGRLLSVPASPEVIGFGRWLVGAMVRQVAGGAAGPGEDRCPFPT